MQRVRESELDIIVDDFQWLCGYELQKIIFDEKVLQLHFYGDQGGVWCTFSMKPGNPYVFFSQQRIHLVKNQKKPLGLFLKTHFVGKKLATFSRDFQKGKVLIFQFDAEEAMEIQFHLVPGRVNVEGHVEKKSVYADKPKQLPEREATSPQEDKKSEGRSNQDFLEHWQKIHTANKKDSKESSSKDLKKKQSGLVKMQERLQELQNDSWKRLGDWLKAKQTLQRIPVEWKDQVDLAQSLSWNIENCYSQAKKNEAKIQGTKKRIEVLKDEISDLESGKVKKPQQKQVSLLAQAEVKGKTHMLSEGRLFIGRSGPENLSLLRKAKPWYYWLHIKDFPGAYGIIERNKGKKLLEKSLREASEWVVKQSLPKGASGHFQVIFAECRYVRPIKGAKSGQVTYSHEKVLTIKVDK